MRLLLWCRQFDLGRLRVCSHWLCDGDATPWQHWSALDSRRKPRAGYNDILRLLWLRHIPLWEMHEMNDGSSATCSPTRAATAASGTWLTAQFTLRLQPDRTGSDLFCKRQHSEVTLWNLSSLLDDRECPPAGARDEAVKSFDLDTVAQRHVAQGRHSGRGVTGFVTGRTNSAKMRLSLCGGLVRRPYARFLSG